MIMKKEIQDQDQEENKEEKIWKERKNKEEGIEVLENEDEIDLSGKEEIELEMIIGGKIVTEKGRIQINQEILGQDTEIEKRTEEEKERSQALDPILQGPKPMKL